MSSNIRCLLESDELTADERKEYEDMLVYLEKVEGVSTQPEPEDYTYTNRDGGEDTTTGEITPQTGEFYEKPTTTDPYEQLFDFTISLQDRLDAIEKINPELIDEVLVKICAMFDYVNTCIVREYLFAICALEYIPLSSRTQTLFHMCTTEDCKREATEHLAKLIDVEILPVVLYMQYVYYLVKYSPDKYQHLFDEFMENEDIDVKIRYSYLRKSRVSVCEEFWIKNCEKYIFSETHSMRLRLICMMDVIDFVENRDALLQLAVSWMHDTELDMDSRADVADMLYGIDEYQEEALKTLRTLGEKGMGVLSTIYDNKQNIHFVNATRDIKRFFEQIQILGVEKSTKTMDEIREELFRYDAYVEALEFSLFRIENQIGTVLNESTLKDIFLFVYEYIENSEYKETLIQRLVEELVDMSNTCTTGYYTRLVNALSGFDDFSIGIDWGTQIQSNLIGRLRQCILENIDGGEEVLNEMTTESYLEKPELRLIYLRNISQIQEDMRKEFAEYIPHEEFDLYFTQAITFFENGK